jgi:hypothetical protein
MTLASIACSKSEIRNDPIRPLSVDATAASASGAASPPATPQVVVPVPFRGAFHLPGHPDAINIIFEDDKSFRWQIYGCDFSGGGFGVWTATPAGLELHAAPGATLTWMDEVSFESPIKLVRVHGGAAGSIDMDVTGKTPADSYKQTWQPGRVCAQCRGGGPVGQVPCNDPIPPTHR